MFSFFRQKYEVFGPHGGISINLSLPSNHRSEDSCDLVIIMHGIFCSKKLKPVTRVAKLLLEEGYAVLSFDFGGHGRSEGKFVDMTVPIQIEEARAVYEYALRLPFVRKIAFLGHSQGGVVAGMLAGQMVERPDCLIQLAPAAVLKDDALQGKFMYSHYDPENVPEYVRAFMHKLGRNYILEARKLPIFETSALYCGPVCLIHGTEDTVVPVTYAEKYRKAFSRVNVHVIDGENHLFNRKTGDVNKIIVGFLRDELRGKQMNNHDIFAK